MYFVIRKKARTVITSATNRGADLVRCVMIPDARIFGTLSIDSCNLRGQGQRRTWLPHSKDSSPFALCEGELNRKSMRLTWVTSFTKCSNFRLPADAPLLTSPMFRLDKG